MSVPSRSLAPVLAPNHLRTVFLAAVLTLAGGAVAWWSSEHVDIAIALLMVPVSLSPMIVRGLQRKWDPFELINVLSFSVFAFYAARPLAELKFGVPGGYLGFNPEPGFVGAVGVAMVGAIATYAGYALPISRRIADRVPGIPDHWDVGLSVLFAGALLLLAALLTALFALSTGGIGFLIKYYSGRDFNTGVVAFRVPAYYTLGPYLTIPASIILAAAASRTRSPLHVGMLVVCVAVALGVTVPRGDRTLMLGLLLPLVVLWFLHRGTRPRAIVMVVSLLAITIPLNVLTETRNSSNRERGSVAHAISDGFSHPTSGVRKFVLSADLSEFTSLEVEYRAIANGSLPLHPWTNVTSLVMGPIPRKIYKNKPMNGDQWINYTIYPFTRQFRAGFGPGGFGDFYADNGWFSLVLYGVLLGIGLRVLWEYFRNRLDHPGARIFYTALLPLVVIVIRASVLSAVSLGVFLAMPLIAFLVVCSRRPPGVT